MNTDGLNLQEFHNYQIEFNICKNDDMDVYSDVIILGVPFLQEFKVIPQSNSLLIKWIFIEGYVQNISFNFDQIYVLINHKKYLLGQEFEGEYLVDNLKVSNQYLITFGYIATKTF